MLADKEKISCRQAIILLLMLIYSPSIRLFPSYSARVAKEAGWLSPLVALPSFFLLVFILQSFFKEHKDYNLSDIIVKIMGSILGRIIVFFYLIWILILLGLYVRYYVERITTSVMPNTPYNFFAVLMLIMVTYLLRKGLVPLARANEIFFLGFTTIFVIIFFLLAPNIELSNLTPITYLDILPVIKSSYAVHAIWGYLLFIFFFADKINDKEHIRRFGLQGGIYLIATALIITISTIGSIGYSIVQRISLPYFIAVKRISILETLERFESVVLALWLISDFTIICIFTYIAASIIKSLFKMNDTKSLIAPLSIFAYIFSLYIAKDRFELERFSTYIALPFNTFMEFIFPAFLWIIGKVRKII